MIDFIEKDRTTAQQPKSDERVANAYGEYSDDEEDNFDEEELPQIAKAPKSHLSKQRGSIRYHF
jgi:hypothetical protein